MADRKTTQPTPLERVAAWAATEPDLTMDDAGRVVAAGEPPLAVDVTADDDRLTLAYRIDHLPAGASLPGRGSPVRGEVDETGAVTLATGVYLDGFTRQSFSTALRALIGAVDAIGAPAVLEAPAHATAERPAIHEPEPTREMPAVWVPTHAVPPGGTRAWADPDPEKDPIATLEARVRLSIAARRGDWAQVVGSNGWSGWVDARALEPLSAETTARPTSGTGMNFRMLPTLGAAVIVLSAFLPWVQGASGDSVNAFDVSARFLVDFNGSGAPDLAWVVIGLAVAALLVVALKGAAPLIVLIGIAAIAAGGLFGFQLYRGVSDAGGTFSDVMDLIKFAPLLTIAGGVLVIVGARK
ncbi:MAG: SH3 domain-containing protein [Actinomycetota bacterium]